MGGEARVGGVACRVGCGEWLGWEGKEGVSDRADACGCQISGFAVSGVATDFVASGESVDCIGGDSGCIDFEDGFYGIALFIEVEYPVCWGAGVDGCDRFLYNAVCLGLQIYWLGIDSG